MLGKEALGQLSDEHRWDDEFLYGSCLERAFAKQKIK